MLISNRTLRFILPSAMLLLCAASAAAATITGTVTDSTTGKPSAGDTIAVINTAQSMDEIVKTTSDASGKFRVTAPDGGQILLHITHNGAEYFKSIQPGSAAVDIEVFDSAKKIDGITGLALVLRAETDPTGKTLNVAENFFVQNTSAPPRTEYGGNTFDFYLPKGAQVVESLASSPGGLPTNTKIVPIDAAGGHYAFTFPIRPGETRFQVAYSLPYTGKQPFSVKLTMPTGDVAVMLPKSMTFQGASFQSINPDPSAQSFDAHQPALEQPLTFTIAGTGQLPQEQQQPQGAAQGGADQSGTNAPAGQAATESRPGGGLGAPMDPEGTGDPWAKYKWWILGGLGLALAVGAGVMLKSTPATAVAGTAPALDDFNTPYVAPAVASAAPQAPPAPTAQGTLLQALKEELFALEADRLSGKLNEADYAQHKAAFDVVLRRALSRVDPS